VDFLTDLAAPVGEIEAESGGMPKEGGGFKTIGQNADK
jgi:hypothetical protein